MRSFGSATFIFQGICVISCPSSHAVKGMSAGTETVLLVEDEADVRLVAKEFLRGFGYTVLEAGNGAEALDVAKNHSGPVHLLLTDIVMPGMSGPDLAAQLTAARAETRVVYMSGYAEQPLGQNQPEATMKFVQKPFTRFSLVQIVRQALNQKP